MAFKINAQQALAKKYTWLGWLLVGLVVITPRVLDLDVFFGRDELTIWSWVDSFALAVRRGDLAGTLTGSDYPGIPLFWAQTLFLTVKYSLPSLFQQTMIPLVELFDTRNLALLAERRWVAAVFTGIQLVGCIWLVRRLFGWPAALLSAIFMGLDPFSLTEARLLRLEMISSLFVCLSVLAYFLYLRQRQRRWLILSGGLAGLAVSSKTSAGLLVPYIWLLLVLDLLLADESPSGLGWLKKLKRAVVDGLLWTVGASGAFWLIWPAMWVRPVEAIQHVFLRGLSQAADRSVWGDKVFFWGQIIDGGDPGPYFYPVVFAFRTTPLTWLGLLSALALVGVMMWRRRSGPRPPSDGFQSLEATLWGFPWSGVAIVLLLAGIILITVELTFVVSKVDRFLILVFPFLNIVSALGLAGLIQEIAAAVHPPGQTWLSAAALILILAWQLGITLPVHPYYFTYWNPWVGGGQAAMEILPMGSGEGIDQAMDFLNSQPNAARSTLVCGASWPWCDGKFNGQTLRFASYFDGEWVTADYASFYISHLQRERFPPEIVDFFKQQKPIYRVELQGATYMWVYTVPKISHFAGRLNDLAGVGRLLGYDLSPALETGSGGQAGDTLEATVWWVNWGGGVDNLVLRWVDETGYEWGRTGIVPWPQYANIAPQQRAVVAGTATLTIPPGTPPGLYFLRIGALEPGTDRLAGEFKMPEAANQLAVMPGRIFTDPALFAISTPVNRPAAPEINLLGYDPPGQVLTAELPAWLTLYWQAAAHPPDYRVLLRLLDGDGAEITRWQGQPGQGHYPTQNWQAGEIVRDVWALQVPPETPIGRYNLEISLVDPAGRANPSRPFTIPNLEVWPQPVNYDVSDMQAELRVNFGNRLTLLGYDLYFDTNTLGQGYLSPVFYWESPADLQQTFEVVLTLRTAANRVVKEWRVPLGTAGPKTFWKAGEIATTIYQLETDTIGQGRYHLDIALRDALTGQVEPANPDDGAGQSFTRIEDIQDKVVVRVVR